jgi:hypothetical protein
MLSQVFNIDRLYAIPGTTSSANRQNFLYTGAE